MKWIIELSNEVELKFENIRILGNRFPEDLKLFLEKDYKQRLYISKSKKKKKNC